LRQSLLLLLSDEPLRRTLGAKGANFLAEMGMSGVSAEPR
jgi:hypothetical protein